MFPENIDEAMNDNDFVVALEENLIEQNYSLEDVSEDVLKIVRGEKEQNGNREPTHNFNIKHKSP